VPLVKKKNRSEWTRLPKQHKPSVCVFENEVKSEEGWRKEIVAITQKKVKVGDAWDEKRGNQNGLTWKIASPFALE
jgi:hypothetical protein